MAASVNICISLHFCSVIFLVDPYRLCDK